MDTNNKNLAILFQVSKDRIIKWLKKDKEEGIYLSEWGGIEFVLQEDNIVVRDTFTGGVYNTLEFTEKIPRQRFLKIIEQTNKETFDGIFIDLKKELNYSDFVIESKIKKMC